jgi:hypothetical protein
MASGTTSIWGRPYPLSTDAPNVHTDIQALANSLETTPLYPTTAVTSRTGIAGESVAVSPSQTLTLPASPAKGDIIQILALGTVTGTTPVTVTASGSKVINGVGLSSASSFLLGMPNAYATVQYDGTAWRVIAGQQDTGWVTWTQPTSWTPTSGNPPAVRVVGNVASMRGQTQNQTGTSQTVYATGLVLPAAAIPTVQRIGQGGGTTGLPGCFFNIPTNGSMQLNPTSAIANNTFINFDGISYSIS